MINLAIVEVSVVPLGTGDTSLSKYVAGCQKILAEEKDIHYQLTPMGSIIEGELDVIFDIIKKLHQLPFNNEAQRVYTNIKIDDRRDKKATMYQKLESVASKL
ncbi:uncharacterized protein (TIGR00106 family) [Orenia metallireducens]|uniref:Uncharacterized protein, MTH1187 family n=1 Tax=Orenia metallireducens TaxID=1413210 RepID=A0A285F6V9_9FIRM|nr:MTH1187 family thiamine-binding protein [Orenia metallireducens]PRX34865.1 uncharacterized protein (TIGR00106 family) [Orenia metallireducens]SNY05941.1 uncharacterized protein, MTH1187 family [Orenia metallireducens]